MVKKYLLYLSISRVLVWFLEKPPTFISNLKDVSRWLLQGKQRFRSKEVLVHNVGGDSVHLHKLLGEPQIPFCVNVTSQLKNAWVLICWSLLCQKLQIMLFVQNFFWQLKRMSEDKLWKNSWVLVARKKFKQGLSNKICKTKQSVVKKHFYKHFSWIKLITFRYETFLAVSENLGGKVSVVDDVLSSTNKKFILLPHSNKTAKSLDLKRIETITLISDRLTWFWNWNLSRVAATKLTIATKFEKEHEEEAKTHKESTADENEEAPVPLVTHVHNILQSFFPLLKCTSTISRFATLMDCMRTNLTFPTNSRGPSLTTREFALRGVRLWILSWWNSGTAFVWAFFRKQNENDQQSQWFHVVWYIGSWFRLIRARANFYMVNDNPNVSLGTVDCSLYTGRIAPKNGYHKKRKDILAYTHVDYNYLETLVDTFIVPARQNQILKENNFNNAPVRQFAIAMNTNCAFTGSHTKNPFWYQQFDPTKIGILRSGQPIVDLEAADNCRLYITTNKAMNFQDDNPSTPTDNFKNHYVLVFDLTSLEDATENCH